MRQGDGSFGSRLRCLWRGWHNPARHPLGGFRCVDCRRVGADLAQMGFEDAYVPALRRIFSRDHRELTRTGGW